MNAWNGNMSAPHPVFQVAFQDWQTRAGVFSAQPNAPQVLERPPRMQWLMRLGRSLAATMAGSSDQGERLPALRTGSPTPR